MAERCISYVAFFINGQFAEGDVCVEGDDGAIIEKVRTLGDMEARKGKMTHLLIRYPILGRKWRLIYQEENPRV